MKERAQQLIEEIQDLTNQYHAEVSSKRKPWPKSIRTRVQELFSLDVPVKKTAAQIDISYATIMSWRRPRDKSKSNFHSLTVKPSSTVTVRPCDSQTPKKSLTVTVRTSKGLILEIPESIAVKIILELQRTTECF